MNVNDMDNEKLALMVGSAVMTALNAGAEIQLSAVGSIVEVVIRKPDTVTGEVDVTTMDPAHLG